MLLINLLGVLHVLAARSKGSPNTPRLGRAVHGVVTAVLLPVTAIAADLALPHSHLYPHLRNRRKQKVLPSQLFLMNACIAQPT